MISKDEIEDLKKAFAQSPENQPLLMMLIRKMKLLPEYCKELEQYVQLAMKTQPDNPELKDALIRSYFAQDKYSTCIVIAEEMRDLISHEAQLMIAKCYLRQGDLREAGEIYRQLLEIDNAFQDAELDQAFRLKEMIEEDDEVEDFAEQFTKPEITFADVGGMEQVKREIDLKIIKPLENAELYASYGKKVGGGILLYGPPGCGKTFIAKATAGEIKANFINISLHDILDMWIGESEKNLNKYFEWARLKKPCVIFVDEVDALGAKRSDMIRSAGKNVINQFLSELDGIDSDNEGILIIGATNTPWSLDPAFRRPGRFDRIIFVPPPDEKSRESILEIKLKGKPQENIDIAQVAKKTKGYSGADINALIDIAVEDILEQAMQSGTPKPITTKDLLNAIKKHKASTVEWFTTAKNYAMFANQSGLYDDILKYLNA